MAALFQADSLVVLQLAGQCSGIDGYRGFWYKLW